MAEQIVSRLIGYVEARGVSEYIDALKRAGKATADAGREVDEHMQRVSSSLATTGDKLSAMGRSTRGMSIAAGVGVGFAIKKFGEFDAVMRQVGAVSGATGGQMKSLNELALKMGAVTSYSAKEAADAMLELSKGGMTQAQIRAGVLKSTLTLAAAGGLELGNAATYMTNTLNAFGLTAKDSGAVAAALAGGANASTASVESLGQGLAQVSAGARNAGLTMNDTIGVLALFDQAGIKGSDAGTSLKTMLQALTPNSKEAAKAMQDLGLKFTDAKGQFLPIASIADQLKAKLGGMSQAQRAAALETIFGADAARAASILMRSGGEGVKKYTKATTDLGAAQRLAKANTSGQAGALERMRGSVETAAIAVGESLSPAVVAIAGHVEKAANKFGELPGTLQTVTVGALVMAAAISPAMSVFGGAFTMAAAVAKSGAVRMLGSLALVGAKWLWAAAQAMIGAVRMAAAWVIGLGPIAWIVAGVIAIVAGAVYLIVKHWDSIKGALAKTWAAVKGATLAAWNGIKAGTTRAVQATVGAIRNVIGAVVGWVSQQWASLRANASAAWSGLTGAIKGALTRVSSVVTGVVGSIKSKALSIGSAIIDGIKSGISSGAHKIIKAVTDLAENAKNALKKKLGIHSPSRVMADEVGVPIAQGIALGINRAANLTTTAAQNLATKLSDTLKRSLRASDLKAAFLDYKLAFAEFAGADTAKIMEQQLAAVMERARKLETYLRTNGRRLSADAKVDILNQLAGLYQNAKTIREQLPTPPATTSTTVPAMARGGIVTRPTMALIGEAGPEAVIPLSQLDRVAGGSGRSVQHHWHISNPVEDIPALMNRIDWYSRTRGWA